MYAVKTLFTIYLR